MSKVNLPVKTILILTQSHLCRNPRVLKEAIVLSQNGYQVKIYTCLLSKQLQQEDLNLLKSDPSISLNWIIDLTTDKRKSFFTRVLFKIGRSLNKHLKIENYWALGYGAQTYLNAAKTLKADLFICHQELASYVGTKLIKAGHPVAFDIEDWYSADLLPSMQKSRPVSLLKKIEKTALNEGAFCVTTAKVLAKKLAECYLTKTPEVIYNVFPNQHDLVTKVKDFNKPLKLFWFSQTVGPGRGIEEFISVLNQLEANTELHLLGNVNAAYRDSLIKLVPGNYTLIFHDLVNDTELPEKIACFDIGLALELPHPPSRNYTITNKFFQYLQSGLPMIATATAGQQEGFEKFNPGMMIPHDAGAIDKKKLENWLNSPVALTQAAIAAKDAARFYSWENESKKLVSLVNLYFAQ